MLRIQLREALKESQKSRNAARTSTLRLVVSALKERDRVQVAEQGKEELTDAEIMQLVQTMIKQRNESIRAYRDGGRDDLVAKEEAEVVILQEFLPKALAEAELDAAIDAIIAELRVDMPDLPKSAMGQIMARLKADFPGQIDMSKASGRVKARL